MSQGGQVSNFSNYFGPTYGVDEQGNQVAIPNSARTGYDFSAGALRAAGQGALQGMDYRPMMVNPNAFRAPTVSGDFGYDPMMVNPMNPNNFKISNSVLSNSNAMNSFRNVAAPGAYKPINVNAGQYDASLIKDANLNDYLNPFTDEVIDRSMFDIDRNRQIARNQIDSQFSAAGAFGGSRQAVENAISTGEFNRAAGDLSSNLRLQGYDRATALAGQDAASRNAASQFNIGTSLNADLANQSAQQRAAEFANTQTLNARLANQQTRANLGLSDSRNALQVALANQSGAIAGGNMDLQAQLANQSAGSRANEFGISSALQAALANQNAYTANNGYRLNAALANQSAGLAGADQRLRAGNQLTGIANLGFNQTQAVNSGLMQQGSMQQALQQQIMNNARNQFQGFTQSPTMGQNVLNSINFPGTTGGSTSQSYSPGLFDYVTLGAAIFSDARLKSNIRQVGWRSDGAKLYEWDWNDEARRIGASNQPTIGVMAHEVDSFLHESGYLQVAL